MLWSAVDRWLVHLADPLDPPPVRPARRLKTDEAERLVGTAHAHGVLPAVMQQLQRDPAAVLKQPADLDPHRVFAGQVQIEQAQLAMLLRRQAAELLRDFQSEGITTVIMKGPIFADQLYPEPGLRPFVDLDLLVPRAAFEAGYQRMRSLSYVEYDEAEMKYDQGYAEVLMYKPDQPGGPCELHWNLVNSPTLRRGLDVSLDDLQLDPDRLTPEGQPTLTPAANLLITAVHAAASHGYDKLQMIIDLLQLARGQAGPIDIDWLRHAMVRTGAELSLAVGLDLAARFYPHDPAPRSLLKQLKPRWSPIFWRRVISPHLLITARDHRRYWGSFRRQWLRHCLKKSQRSPV